MTQDHVTRGTNVSIFPPRIVLSSKVVYTDVCVGSPRNSLFGSSRLFALARFVVLTVSFSLNSPAAFADDKPEAAVVVDKDRKSVAIACKIAPRKLPNLTEVYPIEVIATWPSPEGKKAA